MLKMAAPLERLTSNRLEVGDGEGGDNIGGDSVEIAKKSGKSKSQKLSRSQKSAKLGKNSSKSRNSLNYDAKDNE